MSTRGTIAVRIDGETKGSYNHSDSYPTWLGNVVLKFLRDATGRLDEVRQQARALTKVPKRKPTKAEIARLEPYTNLGVSRGSTEEWYCLLRGTQGDLGKILEAGLYEPFPVGGEEYSYVVDLDAERLIVYDLKQEMASIPFTDLPEEFADDYLSNLDPLWRTA
jgi:hypothetical protein